DRSRRDSGEASSPMGRGPLLCCVLSTVYWLLLRDPHHLLDRPLLALADVLDEAHRDADRGDAVGGAGLVVRTRVVAERIVVREAARRELREGAVVGHVLEVEAHHVVAELLVLDDDLI